MISMERPVRGIMKKAKTPTYVPLFSSAGVGCYGFTKAGFECVATNEIVRRRLDIQRYNHKCVADSGYICADIREQGTKDLVFGEIAKWSEAGNDCIDVLVATPLLRDVIGDLPALSWGEINANDFYHAFRTYPNYMRDWIHGLEEGGPAFDNADPMLRPHRIIDGKAVPNVMKCGDKYKRQYWDRVAPCVHTRNDSMASQNTLHPSEDRVFSIRELMRMMSIPDDFRWVDNTLEVPNGLSLDEKRRLLKSEEIKIRQSIGEAVPTAVFYQVACKIDEALAGGH